MKDTVRLMDVMQDGIKAVTEPLIAKIGAMAPEAGGQTEKFQAIASMERKRNVDQIKDDDPDLDEHDRKFDEAMRIYQWGNKNLRGIDVLLAYGDSFPKGSTRPS